MATRMPRPVRRGPTPRGVQEYPSAGMTVFVCLVIVACFVAALWFGSKVNVKKEAEQRPVHLKTCDSMTVNYTYDGEMIRWYVMTDPDTGVQYVVNDRGGTYPRLDKNGLVMGVDYGE